MTTAIEFGDRRHTDTRGPAARPKTPVLLVDDNPAKRLALIAVLAPLGYEIVEADSGTAALRCVSKRDFAVILLDVQMPIMDGFNTAALIRQRTQSETTPIIFVTAHTGDESAAIDRYAAGAVDFLFAPFSPDELRAKVSVFATLFAKAEALAMQVRAVEASAEQFRRLTDAAPIGIFQTDTTGRYVYTNPRWTEITGVASDDAFGQKWGIIFDPEQRADLFGGSADSEMSRTELSYRFEVRARGSEPRVLLATARSIPDNDGGAAGWVGTLAEVTAEEWVETSRA